MSKELNHSELLRRVAGEGGDYFIDTTEITTKKFSMIKIGPDGATVSVLKIRGVDVCADRNYAILPAGYILCAGGNDYFDAITLTAGNAQGILYSEEAAPGTFAVSVADGEPEAAMTIVLTFDNTGNSGSKKVYWRVRNALDVTVQEGENIVYFLKGSTVTVPIAAGNFIATEGEGYELDIRLEGSDVWTTCAPFNIATV